MGWWVLKDRKAQGFESFERSGKLGMIQQRA